jgi:hypothetical protein
MWHETRFCIGLAGGRARAQRSCGDPSKRPGMQTVRKKVARLRCDPGLPPTSSRYGVIHRARTCNAMEIHNRSDPNARDIMGDVFAPTSYRRLDEGLLRSMERTAQAYGTLVQEVVFFSAEDEDAQCLRTWAIVYSVVMEDLAVSAQALLAEGKYSRAAIMLRRVAFEYRTRFHYYRLRPNQAKLAMDEYNPEAEKFASRLGPGDIAVLPDPQFDRGAFDDARKPYKNFYDVVQVVYKELGPYLYANFYQYPSFLLHGAATASMDVMEGDDSTSWRIHRKSRRAFTDEIAANLLVLLLDSAVDVCQAFDLNAVNEFKDIGHEFNAVRERLGIQRMLG